MDWIQVLTGCRFMRRNRQMNENCLGMSRRHVLIWYQSQKAKRTAFCLTHVAS